MAGWAQGWPWRLPFSMRGPMAKQTRSNDWGFPRWRAYGSARDAEPVRTCDRHGCESPGDRPAPKSPNSRDRWYFCEAHAAEYNRNWNYFEGLSAEDAAAREANEQRDAGAFKSANHYGWGGPGDGSRSREEMRARFHVERWRVVQEVDHRNIGRARIERRLHLPDVDVGRPEIGVEKNRHAASAQPDAWRAGNSGASTFAT